MRRVMALRLWPLLTAVDSAPPTTSSIIASGTAHKIRTLLGGHDTYYLMGIFAVQRDVRKVCSEICALYVT